MKRALTQPPADFVAQDAAAKAAGLNWAEWVRRLIHEALAREKK